MPEGKGGGGTRQSIYQEVYPLLDRRQRTARCCLTLFSFLLHYFVSLFQSNSSTTTEVFPLKMAHLLELCDEILFHIFSFVGSTTVGTKYDGISILFRSLFRSSKRIRKVCINYAQKVPIDVRLSTPDDSGVMYFIASQKVKIKSFRCYISMHNTVDEMRMRNMFFYISLMLRYGNTCELKSVHFSGGCCVNGKVDMDMMQNDRASGIPTVLVSPMSSIHQNIIRQAKQIESYSCCLGVSQLKTLSNISCSLKELVLDIDHRSNWFLGFGCKVDEIRDTLHDSISQMPNLEILRLGNVPPMGLTLDSASLRLVDFEHCEVDVWIDRCNCLRLEKVVQTIFNGLRPVDPWSLEDKLRYEGKEAIRVFDRKFREAKVSTECVVYLTTSYFWNPMQEMMM